MVICCGICTPKCIWEDNGKVVFSYSRLIQPRDLEEDEGLWGCLIFFIQWQPKLEERSAGFTGRQRQPISGLTTWQVTGPEANPGPPAHQLWRLLSGSCSKGRSSRLECLGLAGVFLLWEEFSIQRALTGKEWNQGRTDTEKGDLSLLCNNPKAKAMS